MYGNNDTLDSRQAVFIYVEKDDVRKRMEDLSPWRALYCVNCRAQDGTNLIVFPAWLNRDIVWLR